MANDRFGVDFTPVDIYATAKTKELYSYLHKLSKEHTVVFGHQNDTHKHVSRIPDAYSDTKVLTGSISGIVGIDSLSLTGNETRPFDISSIRQEINTSLPDSVRKSIQISQDAVSEGAILSLSAHMPNMSSDRIKEVEHADGTITYDFSACDFTDCMNMENDCGRQILPDGKYNRIYTAYLDLIADYANSLSEFPILFRPFHECNGFWFWWGTPTEQSVFHELFRYTVHYLMNVRKVHNLLYVYSPNGPVLDEEEYLSRYPGDDCIDLLGFDYYDDYITYPKAYSEEYFKNLTTSCRIVKDIAMRRHKIPAIAETGARIKRPDGNSEGIMVDSNPMAGKNWYSNVLHIASEYGMAYFLLWHNYSEDNFYIPYWKENDWKHEMTPDFLHFAAEDSVLFAKDLKLTSNC